MTKLPLLFLMLAVLPGCSQLVRYTDEIVDRRSGRSPVVTVPATVGGFAGFLLGIPADIVALPATYSIYRLQRSQNKLAADPVSTMLFPSFFLWRAGTLVAAPLDMVEFTVMRAWQAPLTPTREEQAEFEFELDDDTLSEYPVTPIYPLPDQSSANGEPVGGERDGG